MFHNSLWFVVVSDNRRIEETLQGIFPLEDCDYRFQTIAQVEDAALDMANPDVAWIFDCVEGTKIPDEDAVHEERILVAEDGNTLLTDCKVASIVSSNWVMPKEDGYNKELLSIYFGKLARRMKQRADDRRQGICFHTLIDAVPDISWFKDTSGAHLIVNDSFCETVGKSREQIYKKGHCYIWDATKEDEEVCLASDRIIMDKRTTQTFEEPIKSRTALRMFKTYKSALIDINGVIFGTCGSGHDITELRNMNTEMDIILKSIPFAILIEDMDGVVTNKNSSFDRCFPEFADIVGKSSQEWRDSLNIRMLLEDQLMEVLVQVGEDQRIFVFEEEPVLDIFQVEIGRIVTLMDITLEWSISQKNEHTANTDYLTGIHNRRSLMHYLESIYAREDVTLLMLDLDNFKQVNDVYGHKAGDKALIKTAEILEECFKGQFVARMGGDEFMVVVTEKTVDEVKKDTEHLMETMRRVYHRQEEFINITASVGVLPRIMFSENTLQLSDLLKMVDTLLYNAKDNGKNCYCVYGEKDCHSI